MFTMAASGGGTTGGGGGPPGGGGGPPGGGGGGGGPPAAPAAGPPAPPPTLDDLTRLMQDVGNAVGILAQQVLDLTRAQNAGHAGTKDAIPRPKAWDGKGGSAEARHFLATFHNFASAQGTSLNVLDATTGMWTSVPGRWIQAALNLMEADARTWALPYLEEIQAGNMPFGGVWQTFLDHFTRRFAPLNTEDSARDALKRTRQNKGTVAEYMAMFDQYAGQTGWSPVDLRQRFYDGLNDRVKDALAGTHQPIGTIDELRATAQSLDQCWWQREAEKKGHTFTLGNPKLLRSVDRSVRLGRLGVCPECLMAEVGKRLDYNEVRTTERWINTQGESACVTDLQGPPSERTPEEKLWDLKTRAQQYARDRASCDDVRISYLEFLETEAEDDLALAQMIAG
jgi:hypothetical protein